MKDTITPMSRGLGKRSFRSVVPAKAGTHGSYMQKGRSFGAGMDSRLRGNDAARAAGALR